VSVWNETNGDTSFRTPYPLIIGPMYIPYIWVVKSKKRYVGTDKIKCLYDKRQTEIRVSASLIIQIQVNYCAIHLSYNKGDLYGYCKGKVSVWKETNGDKCFCTPNPPNFGSMSIPYIWVVISKKTYVGTAKIKCRYEKRQKETPVSARIIIQICGKCLCNIFD
jgi:hypothetical protein